MSYQSIAQLFNDVSASNADKVAYRYKKDGRWSDITWAETRATVHKIARALMALGIQRGDRVAILSETRLEWALCDFGIVDAAGVTVGIYPSNLMPQCKYVLDHSDSQLVFVEDRDQLEKILSVRSELSNLRHLVIFDGDAEGAEGVLGWHEFLAGSEEISEDAREKRALGVGPEDLVSLVYTSGTTGVPKGVMISHRNLLFTTYSAGQSLHIEPHFENMLFLPLAHVFARLILYCCMRQACTTSFSDIPSIAENLRQVRPHFFSSVPRIYEKIYDKIISGVEAAGGMKQKLFNWALGVGTKVSRLNQNKLRVPVTLRLQYALADKLVLHKIQAVMGGRLVYAISGAAPLNPDIAEFFHACGVLIVEGIGMTENTSFSNVNRIDNNKFGTVGPAGPGVEVEIAEDGEVLFRGENVMKGYFKNPEATAESIDADGWLHSGDIGEIDEDGFLRITDRKKDLIITAGGKNIAPQRIERIMRTSHFVGQVMAYGDKRKYITALVTLDPDGISEWARNNGLDSMSVEQLASEPKVDELIRSEVAERNEQLASFETVKRFRILAHDFSVEAGELTPTMKIRRKFVTDKYRDELDSLYVD